MKAFVINFTEILGFHKSDWFVGTESDIEIYYARFLCTKIRLVCSNNTYFYVGVKDKCYVQTYAIQD